MKILNENTAVSLGLVGVLVSLSVFVNTIYVENRQQAQEIERLQRIVESDSKLRWRQINDLSDRLSRIEGRMGKIEDWCREIVQGMRKNAK